MSVDVKHGYLTIPEYRSRKKHAGRLGRHVQFDRRSGKFRVGAVLPVKPAKVATLQPVVWSRPTAAFNQDGTSGCTGNSAEGQACTYPHRRKGHRYTESEALRVYARATEIDPWPDETFSYPPKGGQDTGSSVLCAIKAAIERGLFGPPESVEYRWVFHGAAELGTAICTVGPACVGVNWYEGFDRPDPAGRVAIAGQVRGGHAFEVLGYDPDWDEFLCVNSWGIYWGVKGRFIVPGRVMDRLLHEQGEAVLVTSDTVARAA